MKRNGSYHVARALGVGTALLAVMWAPSAFSQEEASSPSAEFSGPSQQITIPEIEMMPRLPQPYGWKDWKKTALDFDAFAYDFERKGPYLPAPWWDQKQTNISKDIIGMPSYLGMYHQNPKTNVYDAITPLAAVLAGTWAGIDKRKGTDWVELTQGYFSGSNGQNVYLNNIGATTGQSFWYEILPNLIFTQILHQYPGTGEMESQFKIMSKRWLDACKAMGGSTDPWLVPNFDHTAFDLMKMKPVDNAVWKEADSAAGLGFLMYMAAEKQGGQEYRDAAKWCFDYLDQRETNPFYENILPYGVYAAARSNAENGTRHNLEKLMKWVFDGQNFRRWGVTTERWGDKDCAGLIGSVIPNEGYGFAMNTMMSAATLAPVARYDDRYARAIGKWLLNLANSSRYFYADGLAADKQTDHAWAKNHDPDSCLAYEGVRDRMRMRMRPVPAASGPDFRPGAKPLVLATELNGTAVQRTWEIPMTPGVEQTLVMHAKAEGDAAKFTVLISDQAEGPFREVFNFTQNMSESHRWVPINDSPNQLFVKAVSEGSLVATSLTITDLHVEIIQDDGPYAAGDPTYLMWGPIDLGLYGSAWVGAMAALFERTEVEGVLRVDCTATETFPRKSFPTYLYYNPHDNVSEVTLDVGTSPRDLYDAVEKKFIAKGVSGLSNLSLPPDAARLIVVCPAEGELRREGNHLYSGDVIIDYRAAETAIK